MTYNLCASVWCAITLYMLAIALAPHILNAFVHLSFFKGPPQSGALQGGRQGGSREALGGPLSQLLWIRWSCPLEGCQQGGLLLERCALCHRLWGCRLRGCYLRSLGMLGRVIGVVLLMWLVIHWFRF